MLRIIDNKRIWLTDDEFKLYQEICKSYDKPTMQGEELFKGLFETDANGIIVFLRPPGQKYISMEVYLFLVTIMIHQHIGAASQHVDSLSKSLDSKMEEINKVIERANSLLDKFEGENK